MNFPNTLSILRIVLAPIFIFLFLSESRFNIQLSFIVFTIAALTDWYDGWYARKYGFKTRWGQFLDPLADKILTSSAFLCFYILNKRDPALFGAEEIIPVGILTAIIIARDILLTAARSWKELKGHEFRTSMLSKTKTFIQMTYIFLVIGLFFVKNTFTGTENFANGFLYSEWNYYLLLLITLLTVISGFSYFFESRELTAKKNTSPANV
jgi:CDP-diacylglycerol--glycerol-3-phosphate 3-phosphatidyltransferase